MRAILITLVGVNLVAFALQWFWWHPAPSLDEAPPELEGQSLELLGSESRQSTLGQNQAAPTPTPPRYCVMVGPFAGTEPADGLVGRLSSLEVGAWVQELEVSDGQGYWVYLPPEVSQQAALRRLYELQAKGIDSYVIPRGELANGISLGMFVSEVSAEARRTELSDLGYDAQLRTVDRTLRETWVLMPRREARSLAPSRWETLLERTGDVERRENLCPGVASE
ncbi:SPOR domain-containing protein [Marinimicrobium alkaliphilum]|uniref:SPOR domain-containing protein n=1 Tax=Marinimicrobium alkaliphilum TaxID=2202654 RepID=UPI000DBA217A|nr:SPOR domain-containing protein [Marinimicrobium alkaliphilum]